nr:Uma2 family endonuclease [Planosporangium thailandense]
MANHTIEDVLALPDDAPRVELVDGVMVVVPSPTVGHQGIANLLWAWLHAHCPAHLTAGTALGVAVGANSTCEPDVLLFSPEVSQDNHYLMPHQVMLVVEVVSPSTRRRDRLEKPAVYADAGIPYFWRVEQNPVQVHAYKLTDGIYKEQATSADEFVVAEPFPIRLPIREITP